MPSLRATAHARLAKVVRAIAEAEVAEELGREDVAGLPFLAETADVLERRLVGMPKHFGAGMAMLTLALDGSTVATTGRPFTQLSVLERRKVLARLRGLALGPLGNFMTFYDRMAPFIFWSELEEHGLVEDFLARGQP